ncbi:MAG TPA: kelch repeat-containing protein [Polyangiaceae bacterium]|nr:kelch repeat-containing protein [Polyangiaceae bacterium]
MSLQRGLFSLVPDGDNAALAIGGLRSVGGTLFYATSIARYTWSQPGGQWLEQTPLLHARGGHGALRLSNGKILVAGGYNLERGGATSVEVSSDELLTAGTPTSLIGVARGSHTATLLADMSSVLVAGGTIGNGSDLSRPRGTLLFRSQTGAWEAQGELSTARDAHSATLFDAGVLVVGGRSAPDAYLSTVELYHPNTGTWTLEAPVPTARGNHAAALLGGMVVVTGGFNSTDLALRSVEVYDPAQKEWHSLEPMIDARREHTVTVLDAHHLLVAGGRADGGGSIASAEILSAVLVGESCDPDVAQCLSGHCFDNVCCKTSCDGQCEVCGAGGTCQKVTGEPRNGREACADGYLCRNGACATTCNTISDCQAGYYCDGTHCQAKKDGGSKCGTLDECKDAAACVDGRCCDSACTGQCENCNQEGHEGLCWPVIGAPVGRTACGGVGAGTECGAVCDGQNTDTCTLPAAHSPCGEAECAARVATPRGECAAGRCEQNSIKCEPYQCGGSICRGECRSSTDCAPGYACQATECIPIPGRGDPCPHGECTAGLVCSEDFCCGEVCEAGSSCAVPGYRGSCIKLNGTACRNGLECASGFCVDGVCCDSECDGQCEACNSEENAGTCLPVRGPPQGPLRAACAIPNEICAQKTCDGVTRSSCQAFEHGSDVACSEARCQGSTFFPAASCDGAGTCAPEPEITCGEYACTNSGCRSSCRSDGECSENHVCRSEKCTSGARCLEDGTHSQGVDGRVQDCEAYRCRTDGACGVSCNSSADCAPTYVCDGEQRKCISATFDTSGGGSDGCGCRLAGAPGSARVELGLLTLLAGLSSRRKRGARAWPFRASPRSG